MGKQQTTLAVAGAIIGAAVVGWVPATSAAPVSSSMTAFKQATLSDVTDVRYYRRYYGRRVYPGAAIGLGIAGAAAAAAAAGSGYYYGPGYYGPGYGYPGYYGPGYGYYVAPYPYRRYYYPY